MQIFRVKKPPCKILKKKTVFHLRANTTVTKLHSGAANNTSDNQLFTYHAVRGIQPCVNIAAQCALPTTHVIVKYLLITLCEVYNSVLTKSHNLRCQQHT